MSCGKTETIDFRFGHTLQRAIVCCLGTAFFSLGFAQGSYIVPNPSPHQIDSLWRALYGSPVHQAIVVFNKMSGGTTTDASKDTVCIMRLVSDSNKASIKPLFYYKQAQTYNNMFGSYSGYRISPDGAKIACFNNSVVQVADTGGANIKVIKSVNLNTDMLALSWDDSAGTRRLVYSIGSIIVRTIISENNTGGKTDTLWSYAWGKDPAQGNSVAYTSVNKSGHFLSFNMQNTQYPVNLPVIADLSTKTAKNPTSGGDGCQIRMVQDQTGTISYHESTHLTAATLWQWPSTKLTGIPCPNGQSSNCSDCGNNFFYWCDSDTNFMAQAGDNSQNIGASSPGCYTKVFIRKGKTSSHMLYLGDYIGYPALWIDPKPFGATGTLGRMLPSVNDQRVTIALTGGELTLSGAMIDKTVVYDLNGAVAARGFGSAMGCVHISLSKLHAGAYLLAWREGNSVHCRYITLSR
jgi:hypothetical protein